jgi:hypothetical protein
MYKIIPLPLLMMLLFCLPALSSAELRTDFEVVPSPLLPHTMRRP